MGVNVNHKKRGGFNSQNVRDFLENNEIITDISEWNVDIRDITELIFIAVISRGDRH